MKNRPDYSEYVAHFTRAVAIGGNESLNAKIGSMAARERLTNILAERSITATKKYYSLGYPSVAFTECPWTSLLEHAGNYSPYGIGFKKQLLWDAGGQPAVYLRSEFLEDIKTHADKDSFPLVSQKFGALYTPIEREPGWHTLGGTKVDTRIDFAHEREWRVLDDFDFDLGDIEFIVVNRFSDTQHLPSDAIAAVGEDRILSMSNYRRITELWPPWGKEPAL
jgi:hypothetical protein